MNDTDTILLIEDDEVDVMTVKRALRKLEIKNPLHVERDGLAALAYLLDEQTRLPAIILLDLNMPRMNGLEFLQEKRQIDLIRPIPIIVLTTSKAEEDRLSSFNLGVSGYMIKQMDFSKFMETIAMIKHYWNMSMLPYS